MKIDEREYFMNSLFMSCTEPKAEKKWHTNQLMFSGRMFDGNMICGF